jgi:hypothetical protein
LLQSVRRPRPHYLSADRRRFVVPQAALERLELLAREWIASAPATPTEADLLRLPEALDLYEVSRTTVDRSPSVRKFKDPDGNAQSPVFVLRQEMDALVKSMGRKAPAP